MTGKNERHLFARPGVIPYPAFKDAVQTLSNYSQMSITSSITGSNFR